MPDINIPLGPQSPSAFCCASNSLLILSLFCAVTASFLEDVQKDYQQAAQSVEQIEITGEGKRIGGIWYYVVPEAVRQQLSNQLRKHLGLATES